MAQRDKGDYYIIINASIHQENIIIVNCYEPNIKAPKYLEWKLTEQKC